jgi:V/A-type H+-transporting ATPase subunit C
MREVENVRAIARGKEAGLDAETIEAELVIL